MCLEQQIFYDISQLRESGIYVSLGLVILPLMMIEPMSCVQLDEGCSGGPSGFPGSSIMSGKPVWNAQIPGIVIQRP